MSTPRPDALLPGEPDPLENLHGFYTTFGSRFPGSRVRREPNLILVDSALGFPEMNVAFVESSEGGLRSAELAARYFRERSRSWRLEGPLSLARELTGAQEALGLGEPQMRPAMLLLPETFRRRDPPSGLRIETVDSPERGAVFLRTLVEGTFGAPTDAVPRDVDWELPPQMRCYLGLLDHEPVGTAILFAHHRVAGVYAVSTTVKARRQGVGRALTERAVADGLDAGCRLSFLQSSGMARSLYQEMGYTWAFDRPNWNPAD